MASPRPDPLRAVDRVLAPLTWLAAAFAVVVLFAGPELIGADKPGAAAGLAAAAAGFFAPITSGPTSSTTTANAATSHVSGASRLSTRSSIRATGSRSR